MIDGGVIISITMGFQTSSKLWMKNSMSKAQTIFHHTISPFGTFRTILWWDEWKLMRSQNHHFHFNHKHKTVKKSLSCLVVCFEVTKKMLLIESLSNFIRRDAQSHCLIANFLVHWKLETQQHINTACIHPRLSEVRHTFYSAIGINTSLVGIDGSSRC